MNNNNKRRLIHDISFILKNPLTNDGIYYTHDEEDMLVGYAMIIGPRDSVYSYGYYFFKFHFSENYPYSPPVVKFYGADANIRFHPNLYRNGKICLSILNTWKGEGWTSCQNIQSILITILSLLDNKPLLHEPGITEQHKDFNNYNELIQYSNYNCSLLKMIYEENVHSQFISFYSLIKKTFFENYKDIIEKLEKFENTENDNKIINVKIYGSMNGTINYKALKDKIIETYNLLKE
jgi:ubiquitin-conjugating enzyme E2 Z